MASPILKLEQGGDTLDINAGRYCVEESVFTPPTTNRSVRFGRSTTGSEFSSERRENRRWTVELNIKAASIAEAERALRDLQAFLNRAGKSRSEPLYIAYRSYNDYDFEPYFGQFGAFSRYEVVNADAMVRGRNYLNTVTNSNVIVGVEISMVIKPQARGIAQRAGSAGGVIIENYFGNSLNHSSGTMIYQHGANDVPNNPNFMDTTSYDNGWSVGGTGTIKSENIDARYIKTGNKSLKLSSIQTDNSATLTASFTAFAGRYVVSVLCKRADGGVITSSELGFTFAGSTGTGIYVSMGDGWYWCQREYSSSPGATVYGIYWDSPVPLYVDTLTLGFTVSTVSDRVHPQNHTSYSPYKVTGTVDKLVYNFGDVFPSRNQWTARIVWNPPPYSEQTRYFFEDSNDDIAVYIDASDQIVARSESASSVTSSAISITPGTPVIIHVTYDGDAITIYNAGSSVGSGSSKSPDASVPTSLYVGSDDDRNNKCYGTIMGLAVFPEVMTAAQVTTDYNQVLQQASDGQRIDPLPYIWTRYADGKIYNDQTGSAESFGFISGLMGDDAELEYYFLNSATYDSSHGVIIGTFTKPHGTLTRDFLEAGLSTSLHTIDGTGTADTAAYSDTVERASLNTTITEFVDTDELGLFYQEVKGEELWALCVYKDAGSNLQLRAVVNLGSEKLYSEWRNVSSNASNFLSALLGPINIPDNPSILDAEQKIGFAVEARRSVSGAANLDVSHAVYLHNCTYIPASKLQSPSGADGVFVKEREAIAINSSGSSTLGVGRIPLLPRAIKINPHTTNGIIAVATDDGQQWTATHNVDIDKFSFTPLWDIY